MTPDPPAVQNRGSYWRSRTFAGLALSLAPILMLSLFPWQVREYKALYVPLHAPVTPGEFVDAICNFWFYLPLGIFAFLSFPRDWRGWMLAILAGFSLSCTIEFLQHWVPNRVPAGNDIAANTLGTLAGATAGWIISRSRVADAFHRFLESPRWTLASQELVLLLLWAVAQGFPFVPSFRRSQLIPAWNSLQHLSATWPEMGAAFFGFMALAVALSRPRWEVLAWLILPLQAVVQSRQPSPGKMAAALAGWLVAHLFLKSNVRTAAWLLTAWLVCDELRPFHLEGPAQPFSWIPGEGVFFTTQGYVVLIAVKLFLMTTCLRLLDRSGLGLRIPATALALFLLAGELVQQYLPGRTPELTDPLLALLGACFLSLMGNRSRAPLLS